MQLGYHCAIMSYRGLKLGAGAVGSMTSDPQYILSSMANAFPQLSLPSNTPDSAPSHAAKASRILKMHGAEVAAAMSILQQ